MKKTKSFLVSALAFVFLFLLFPPAFAANDITYVSSILWTEVKDVQIVGNYAYCAFANGLVILDISDPATPTFVSKLYFKEAAEGLFAKDN